MLLMTLVVGCANKPIVFNYDDRQFVKEGETIQAPKDGVYLSGRAFKHYSKGCR